MERPLPTITSWLRFQLPLEHDTRDDSKNWHSIFSGLVTALGHKRSFWGRIQDDPETVILYTLWDSRESFTAFESSSLNTDLINTLQSLSNTKSQPTSTVASFDNILSKTRLGPHTQLRSIYFPTPISSDSRRAIESIQGLVYPYGAGFAGPSSPLAYRTPPSRGWKDGMTAWNGRQCIVSVWVMSWIGKEAEMDFLQNVSVLQTGPGPVAGTSSFEGSITMSQHWENQLKAQGALGWIDEYVDFGVLPGVRSGR